jgi:hypothetical protein
MSTLYLFAIGGTGSRILKSLTMLLAAGAKPEGDWNIKSVIIDPHVDNKDLIRTKGLMELYGQINNDIDSSNAFFGTKMSPMIGNSYVFDVKPYIGSTDDKKTFSEAIAFNQMGNVSESSRDLSDILFSGKSGYDQLMNLTLKNGFIGNPNLGSVVLNEVAKDIVKNLSNVQTGDKIFIISSIFGGTGAAGFPLLLKKIKDADNKAKELQIGALVVLPYFAVKEVDGSGINSKDFMVKTKSALTYYRKSVNDKMNAIYYIKNSFGNPIENDPGDNGQQDPAHWIELAGATAIIDFMDLKIGDEKFADFALETIKKEDIDKPIKLRSFIDTEDKAKNYALMRKNMENKICLPLAQFTMFWRYIEDMKNELGKAKHTWLGIMGRKSKSDITLSFMQGSGDNNFMPNLKNFFKRYEEWLGELTVTGQGFEIFDMDWIDENQKSKKLKRNGETDILLREFILNRKAPDSFLPWNAFNYGKYNNKMNKLSLGADFASNTVKNPQSRLIKIFFEATNSLLKKHYKFE